MGVGVSWHRRRPQRGAWTDVRRCARPTEDPTTGAYYGNAEGGAQRGPWTEVRRCARPQVDKQLTT